MPRLGFPKNCISPFPVRSRSRVLGQEKLEKNYSRFAPPPPGREPRLELKSSYATYSASCVNASHHYGLYSLFQGHAEATLRLQQTALFQASPLLSPPSPLLQGPPLLGLDGAVVQRLE